MKRGSTIGYKGLALVIALFLWSVANGSSSIERAFDLPIVLRGVPPELVVTDQSADVVNVRVLGTRAVLRNLELDRLEYSIDVATRRPGTAVYEVDPSTLELPRGLRIVSRSPARIELGFEPRGRKTVRVRAELEGEPAPGFELGAIEVDPPRVKVSGARSEVLRLTEVTTDAVDVNGLDAPVVREVRLLLGGNHVWLDDDETGTASVKIGVVPKAAGAAATRGGEG